MNAYNNLCSVLFCPHISTVALSVSHSSNQMIQYIYHLFFTVKEFRQFSTLDMKLLITVNIVVSIDTIFGLNLNPFVDQSMY